jgi:hypothetical protein
MEGSPDCASFVLGGGPYVKQYDLTASGSQKVIDIRGTVVLDRSNLQCPADVEDNDQRDQRIDYQIHYRFSMEAE